MKHFLYCILRNPVAEVTDLPVGIGGRPVFAVAAEGLSAVVSRVADDMLTPSIINVTTFERVVERLHRHQAVIPMRYGCVLDGTTQLRNLLKQHKKEYRTILRELDGRVEMGVRVWVENAEANTAAPSSQPDSAMEKEAAPGVSYLAVRKEYYRTRDAVSTDQETTLKTICTLLKGQYVKYRPDSSQTGSVHLLSVNFLVPRTSVRSFREATRQIQGKLLGRVLVTGPWPPYNFVATPGGSSNAIRVRN